MIRALPAVSPFPDETLRTCYTATRRPNSEDEEEDRSLAGMVPAAADMQVCFCFTRMLQVLCQVAMRAGMVRTGAK